LSEELDDALNTDGERDSMTEDDWLTCKDARRMLDFLGLSFDPLRKVEPNSTPVPRNRKVRLFAVAVCRRAWKPVSNAEAGKAIDVAERFADGLATAEELQAARKLLWDQLLTRWSAPFSTAVRNSLPMDRWSAAIVATFPEPTKSGSWSTASALTGKHQPELLRCIFGNPFRAVSADPSWLAWNNGTVVKLAQATYDDRASDRLPILADALEDAGCRNQNILSHCRQSGDHFRACWVVDLLLNQ